MEKALRSIFYMRYYMFIYKIDVLSDLRKHGLTPSVIRKNKIIAEKTMTNFRNGKVCGINELDKLCSIFNVQPGEIIEWIPDDSHDRDSENDATWYTHLS